VQQLDLSWSRRWGARTSTVLSAYSGNDSYNPSGREDQRFGYSVALNYNLPRFGTIGARVFHRERDAGFGGESYSDQGVEFYFNIGAIFGFGYGDSRAPAVCDLRTFAANIGRSW